MARVKQTARKAGGGKGPTRYLLPTGRARKCFINHLNVKKRKTSMSRQSRIKKCNKSNNDDESQPHTPLNLTLSIRTNNQPVQSYNNNDNNKNHNNNNNGNNNSNHNNSTLLLDENTSDDKNIIHRYNISRFDNYTITSIGEESDNKNCILYKTVNLKKKEITLNNLNKSDMKLNNKVPLNKLICLGNFTYDQFSHNDLDKLANFYATNTELQHQTLLCPFCKHQNIYYRCNGGSNCNNCQQLALCIGCWNKIFYPKNHFFASKSANKESREICTRIVEFAKDNYNKFYHPYKLHPLIIISVTIDKVNTVSASEIHSEIKSFCSTNNIHNGLGVLFFQIFTTNVKNFTNQLKELSTHIDKLDPFWHNVPIITILEMHCDTVNQWLWADGTKAASEEVRDCLTLIPKLFNINQSNQRDIKIFVLSCGVDRSTVKTWSEFSKVSIMSFESVIVCRTVHKVIFTIIKSQVFNINNINNNRTNKLASFDTYLRNCFSRIDYEDLKPVATDYINTTNIVSTSFNEYLNPSDLSAPSVNRFTNGATIEYNYYHINPTDKHPHRSKRPFELLQAYSFYNNENITTTRITDGQSLLQQVNAKLISENKSTFISWTDVGNNYNKLQRNTSSK